MPNATSEPANEIEPTIAENRMPIAVRASSVSTLAGTSCSSATAISAAAPPPTPLNSATICGIAVMRTRRAETAPIALPTATPPAIHQ